MAPGRRESDSKLPQAVGSAQADGVSRPSSAARPRERVSAADFGNEEALTTNCAVTKTELSSIKTPLDRRQGRVGIRLRCAAIFTQGVRAESLRVQVGFFDRGKDVGLP